jgi:hypothetical protein
MQAIYGGKEEVWELEENPTGFTLMQKKHEKPFEWTGWKISTRN